MQISKHIMSDAITPAMVISACDSLSFVVPVMCLAFILAPLISNNREHWAPTLLMWNYNMLVLAWMWRLKL